MSNGVEVSVVVPCRNAAATLPELLESLCGQQIPGTWELVAVDDRSTDDTRRILEQFAERLPLRIVEPPPGPAKSSRARNYGVEVACGEIVVFVDADDTVDPGWGAAMVNGVRRHGFVGCHVDDTQLNTSTWRRARAVDAPDGLLTWWDYPYPCAAGGAIAIRRDLYQAVGGMDESFESFEDVDFCWRVQQDQGVPLVYVPEAVLHYRYRTSFRGVYRQARSYGAGMVAVYGRYRSRGLPVPPHQWSAGFWAWARSVARVVRVRDRGDLGAWLWRIGGLVGLLEASIRERRLLLCADPAIGRSPFSRAS